MQGPTLAMPPVSSTNSTLPRSHSSPNIPEFGNIEYKKSVGAEEDDLPRSASFSCLPNLESQYHETQDFTRSDVQDVMSTEIPLLKSPDRAEKTKELKDGKIGSHLMREETSKLERTGRRKSLVARPKSWIQRVKASPERPESPNAVGTPSDIPPVPQIFKVSRDTTKTVSESFATFARKSWITSSRSPSPGRSIKKAGDQDGNPFDISKSVRAVSFPSLYRTIAASRIESPASVKVTESPLKEPNRNFITVPKVKPRTQSVMMSFTTLNSANSSTSSLPRSSMDNKSTPRTSSDKIPPLPKTFSTERLHNFGVDIPPPRKKDELWSVFRSLENDLSKFQSKSWTLKTNVVRAALLPFLRNYASHLSNKDIRPEDLDRRVNILNKWWLGILEVLDGRQNQILSGVDRPVLLEAVIGIMTRPEWRQSPSAFASLSDRSYDRSTDGPLLQTRQSSASLKSSASQFIAESVHHNVRNIFIQNLLSQMTYVVDKMSLKHAPASLVTFCGKAAAYAFYFVPGIADILVRVWKLQPETLRRAADELGLPRRFNRLDAEDVAIFFPPQIRQLAWTSVKSMSSQLRSTPNLSIIGSKIAWNGPWAARWCGRDSDLFYVFAKHYHILVEDFLPSDLSFVEKSRAPG